MFDQLKMLAKAREIQKKLSGIVVENEYNGIKVTLNGKQEILNIEIPETMLENKSTLEYNMKEAINKAITKSQREMAQQMQGDMAGLM